MSLLLLIGQIAVCLMRLGLLRLTAQASMGVMLLVASLTIAQLGLWVTGFLATMGSTEAGCGEALLWTSQIAYVGVPAVIISLVCCGPCCVACCLWGSEVVEAHWTDRELMQP